MKKLFLLLILCLVLGGLGTVGAQTRYDGVTVNVIAQRTPEMAGY